MINPTEVEVEFKEWWETIKEKWDEDYWALSDEEFALAGWQASASFTHKQTLEKCAELCVRYCICGIEEEPCTLCQIAQEIRNLGEGEV